MGIESKVHQTTTRALVHPMEETTEEEEEEEEGGVCCKKYEFEKQRGNDEVAC